MRSKSVSGGGLA